MKSIGVKLIGAGGYGGLGMIELLLRHPVFKLATLVDVDGVGKPISAMWPYLQDYCDAVIVAPDSPEALASDAAVAVCATPDGVGQITGPKETAAGRRLLDYSGDYRFNSLDLYRQYAQRIGRDPAHKAPDLLASSAYGLSELHRKEIAAAPVVGNPGCFAVSCILGLAPAVKDGLVEVEGIVCDCKTGVSGAGKKAAPQFHYPERYDAANAYRLSGHQHVMEIERELSVLAGRDVRVTFTPQVVPMTRGILSTLYGRLPRGVGQADVLAAYRGFYADEPFVKVRDAGQAASTSDVRGSNRVVVTVACDERTGTFRAVSHIDNLVKGQAGSALQNLNIMFGLAETLGLDQPGAHP
ncbi:MAG: N-acetyl-gamma-glutamyl-phosphate reductase [Planctomycetes bacterium]|nr:N-acetyl-gamma-glutamyl-phosphate reductase [Planctomycetota bacterium]